MKLAKVYEKALFTVCILFLIRLGYFIPVPKINQSLFFYQISLNKNFFIQSLFNKTNSIFSIFILGLVPYINASLIIQFLTSFIPYFEKLQKDEGQAGRLLLNQYTKSLTLICSIIGVFTLFSSFKFLFLNFNFFSYCEVGVSVISGTFLLLSLSDLLTKKGFGNGISLVITLNLLSNIPLIFQNTANFSTSSLLCLFYLLLLVVGLIYIQEGISYLPLTSAKLLSYNSSKKSIVDFSLPLKVNQGGIMPFIFALTAASSLVNLGKPFFISWLPSLESTLYYFLLLFFLVSFSLIYANIVFNSLKIAKDLNKNSVSLQGVRPGRSTALFLERKIRRLSILSSILLFVFNALQNFQIQETFSISSLILLISVTIEISREIETAIISDSYSI
jgi:preprotein translocase subunit SecY